MAEENKDEKKPAKKHLHEIRSEQTEDGHILHHHTYKKKRGDAETEPERKNMAVARKSLVAARDLPRGARLAAGDVLVKRPGTGIPPAGLAKALGRTLARAVRADEVLTWKHLSRP